MQQDYAEGKGLDSWPVQKPFEMHWAQKTISLSQNIQMAFDRIAFGQMTVNQLTYTLLKQYFALGEGVLSQTEM